MDSIAYFGLISIAILACIYLYTVYSTSEYYGDSIGEHLANLVIVLVIAIPVITGIVAIVAIILASIIGIVDFVASVNPELSRFALSIFRKLIVVVAIVVLLAMITVAYDIIIRMFGDIQPHIIHKMTHYPTVANIWSKRPDVITADNVAAFAKVLVNASLIGAMVYYMY